MQIGIISSLVRDREYGKIKVDNDKTAHFHKNCLWDVSFDQLMEGQEVEFELQQSYKGFLAFHIRLHNEARLH